MAEVRYHPEFVRQLKDLASKAESEHWLMELLGEVMALLRALEDHGHDIEGYQPADASHPIVTSRFRAFALRRTPPTVHTPYAEDPPILRIPYVWFDRADGSEVAVGDVHRRQDTTGSRVVSLGGTPDRGNHDRPVAPTPPGPQSPSQKDTINRLTNK